MGTYNLNKGDYVVHTSKSGRTQLGRIHYINLTDITTVMSLIEHGVQSTTLVMQSALTVVTRENNPEYFI